LVYLYCSNLLLHGDSHDFSTGFSTHFPTDFSAGAMLEEHEASSVDVGGFIAAGSKGYIPAFLNPDFRLD